MKILHIGLLTCTLSFAIACGSKKEEEKKESQETKEAPAQPQEEKKEALTAKPDLAVPEVKMLVKKWALKSIEHKDGRKDKPTNAFLELKEDGTFVEFFGGKEIASGNWELSADKKTFTLIHKTGTEASTLKDGKEKSAIKEITENKFVTEDDNIEIYEPAK